MAYVCPQWPDRCCFCLTKRAGAIFTGFIFCLLDLFVISACVYTFIDLYKFPTNSKFSLWGSGYDRMEKWVLSTRWDSDITSEALKIMNQFNINRDLLLYIIITISGIHALTGLLVIIGACLPPSPRQRLLFLPWLTLDMFFIILTTALFVSWAFLSFFVHILVAIFFPVVSGALLGLWIYAWRNVREHFIVCGQLDDIDLAKARANQSAAMYRKLPPATSQQSPTEVMRSSNHGQPNYDRHRNQNFVHHQVPV